MIKKLNQAATAAFAALLLCFLFSAPQAQAQALYGSIVGTVTDSSEAAVPGARVRITHNETNQSREATTGIQGDYSFPSLPSGAYSVTITHDGFQTSTQRGVNVTVGSVVRANATLEVGAVTEVVQVDAQAITLQTDRAEVRGEVATKTLEEMPVPVNRNYQNLLILIPGFTPPNHAHSVSANPSRGLQFNVNGATRNSNAVRIEGASATNVWLPHVTAYVPGLESIETVSAVTGSLDADQGLAGGASINVQMKSGTNEIHGSLFGFHTNNALKAKPFFLPQGERNPKAIDNQLGGTIGGPIKKDKVFYFFGYDGQFQRQTANGLRTVPTAAIRSGDMSASPNPIYNPFTGNANGTGKTPFANNFVPLALRDPAVEKMVAITPLPNIPGGLLTNNYFATGSLAIDRHKYDSKVNWNASDAFRLSARVGILDLRTDSPAAFGDHGNNIASFAGREGIGSGVTWNSTFSASYVFSPTFLFDTHFGYTRVESENVPFRVDENLGLDFLGIPGTNGPDRLYGGYPQFNVNTYTIVGKGSAPIYYNLPSYEYVANFSVVKGTHNVKFGANIARNMMNNFEVNGAGTFTFNGGSTALSGGPSANQFNSYADFLLGTLSAASTSVLFEGDRATSRTWSYSLYARDQWQATRKLTFSYGLRWDYFPMGVKKDRGFQKYDFVNDKVLVCGVGSIPRDCGVTTPLTNFSPRLGIAYRATNTFVIRAGYGINYDPQPLSFVRNLLGVHPTTLSIALPPAANAFTRVGLLRDGLPPIPVPENFDTGIIDMPSTTGFFTPPDSYTFGYVQSWNFSLEKDLGAGFIGQAGYVGTRQIKQLQALDLNVQRVGGGRDSQPLFQQFGRTGAMNLLTNYGHSYYDSLQASLKRSFAQGFQFNLAYTYSKAIGMCCDDLSDKRPAIQIPEFLDLNKALAPFDRPHVLSMATVLELPFGNGKRWANTGGVGAAIAGGWQINALFTAYSGRPFSVSAAGGSLNAANNDQRADQIKPEVAMLGGTGPNQSWFDPLAFAPVTEARFGTAGFNTVRGPNAVNLDFGIVRNFQMGERFTLQFRGEALNLTNTPHFNNPASNVSNLQLNPDGTIRNLGGFTTISSTTGTGREGIDERVFRFGMRLRF